LVRTETPLRIHQPIKRSFERRFIGKNKQPAILDHAAMIDENKRAV